MSGLESAAHLAAWAKWSLATPVIMRACADHGNGCTTPVPRIRPQRQHQSMEAFWPMSQPTSGLYRPVALHRSVRHHSGSGGGPPILSVSRKYSINWIWAGSILMTGRRPGPYGPDQDGKKNMRRLVSPFILPLILLLIFVGFAALLWRNGMRLSQGADANLIGQPAPWIIR